jgi:hypothetical protein
VARLYIAHVEELLKSRGISYLQKNTEEEGEKYIC